MQGGSELIGRSGELEGLTAALERARSGRGGVVVLWGSAGIGKTRLLAEFLAQAATTGDGTAMASCFEYLSPPFGPFDDLFRLLGIPAAEPGDASAGDPAAAKHARFLCVANGLRAAGARASLAVAIDDAQWADHASLEMLAFAARALHDAPVLVVATVRSDDIERDAARFEMIEKLRKDAVASIELPALSGAETRRLIARLAPEPARLDAARIARICELAEGRPYFVEELVRAALSTHGDVEAPPSIRSSVLARFKELSPEDRAVVAHAAAIGRRFDAAFLAAITRVPLERVWKALTAARALQLVRDDGGGGEISFRHAITREVVYRELLTVQARAIHAEIAALLERGAVPVDAGELAHHWGAAGDAARATAYYVAAGDAACARNAYHDACIAYRCALQTPSAVADRAALCEKYARTLSTSGDVPAAIVCSREAVEAYAARGDAAKAARTALWRARRQYDHGEADAAIATARWALETLAPRDNPALRYDAHVTLASFETLQGRPAAALAHLDSAESLNEGQSAEARSGFHIVRAMVYASDRRLRLAFDEYAHAIAFARESGSDGQLAWVLSNFGSRAAETGRLDLGLPAFAEAVACAEAQNLGKNAAPACQGFACAHVLAGNLDDALAMRERGLGILYGSVLIDAMAFAVMLRVAFLRGDATGDPFDDSMVERAFASGETQVIGLLVGSLAPLLDAVGRRAEAKRLRERALAQLTGVISSLWLLDQCAADESLAHRARAILADAARDPDNRAAVAHLRLFDARVARRSGDATGAKALAFDAAERFAAIGMPWEEGQAHELAGEPARALALYAQFGFEREVRRVTEARRRARHRPHSGGLTAREIDVARLAASGMSNRLIGETLFISQRTVETHIASMFDRFDLTSRVQLVDLIASLGAK